MQTVAVTGVSGLLGRRVLAQLAEQERPPAVVGIDLERAPRTSLDLTHHPADLATADLKPLLEGCDTVVHLAFVAGEAPHDLLTSKANVVATRRLLDAAADVGVESVVVVSSATAYGAWESNPVPLTEDAPLRPNPGFVYGAHKAEVERVCTEWSDDQPGVALAVLRPAVAVREDGSSWLALAMQGAALLRTADDAPPAQFLHLDDLASAVVHAAARRLRGPFNVAPDGFVSGEELRALAGGAAAVTLPTRAARRLTRLGRDLGLAQVPDGLEPYLRRSWVVANDRLKATGWQPAHTNEQAFVATHPASRWTEMSPRKRQNLALAVTASGLVGAAAGVAALVRRRRG